MTENIIAPAREWQGITIPAPGTFTLDTAHTVVGFVAKHMMFSKVRGNFPEVEGTRSPRTRPSPRSR
ncbi:MAG: YceI family protein [Jiangellaceae bacterium]